MTQRAIVRLIASAAVAGVVAVAATAATALAAPSGHFPATQKVIAFDQSAKPPAPAKKYRIAYLTECISNPYCQARLAGMKAAAKKYGFEFKIFDANFSPSAQLKLVQDAVTQGFDGYIFAPAADAAGCSMWKSTLKPTGKPVVSIDLPMCKSPDYTPGLAATVTFQRQGYFDAHVANAFASCKSRCEAVAVGGFAGSDLFGFWQKAIKKAKAKYPNVKVVSDQPGNFDPRVALKVVGDALRANPNVSLVISSWDDMTRGAEQAIRAAGKKPGTDVAIYSIGGSKDGVARVKAGSFTGTTILRPFEESYYGAVAMIMALQGKPLNGYVSEAELPAVTKLGTIFVTKGNAASYRANY